MMIMMMLYEFDYQQQLYRMEGVLNSVRYGLNGLSDCNSGSCASQIIQIVISGAIMIWLLVEFIMQIKVRMRLSFSWQEVMLIQIFLCLSFNICFMVTSTIILWYVLENLIYQFYFTTLVYYFSKKYIEKTVSEEHRRPYIITLLVIYALFCLGELGIFIYMVDSGLGHCKQIAELIINAVMISLGVVFFVLAYQSHQHQIQKFQDYKITTARSPFRTIWMWVLANIFGQAISEIEGGLVYGYYGGQECYPVESTLEIQILGPIFMVLSYAIPFCSTLWFYSQRRRQTEQGISMLTQLELSGAQADVQNRVELIVDSTQRGITGSLSEALIAT